MPIKSKYVNMVFLGAWWFCQLLQVGAFVMEEPIRQSPRDLVQHDIGKGTEL